MAVTNLETILNALATAIEAIAPDYKPGTTFKRWRGEKRVEDLAQPIRERAFQFRMGRTKTPRTLSSPTKQWNRAEFLLVIGYVFEEPRQGDALGLGSHRIVLADAKHIRNKLFFANSLSGVSNVYHPQSTGSEEPGNTSHAYRFDLEWAETFTA